MGQSPSRQPRHCLATPLTSLLVLIAFIVAAASLLVQGSTLSTFVAWIKPAAADEQAVNEERGAVLALLRRVESDVTDAMPRVTEAQAANPTAGLVEDHAASKRLALAIIEAQRGALLDARDDGSYAVETLNSALVNLDAEQISLELRGAPPEL